MLCTGRKRPLYRILSWDKKKMAKRDSHRHKDVGSERERDQNI